MLWAPPGIRAVWHVHATEFCPPFDGWWRLVPSHLLNPETRGTARRRRYGYRDRRPRLRILRRSGGSREPGRGRLERRRAHVEEEPACPRPGAGPAMVCGRQRRELDRG